ncbi:hypothetical protein D3C73_1007740 [compost metagenome]
MHIGLVVAHETAGRDIGQHQRARTEPHEIAAAGQKILDDFSDRCRRHMMVGADAGHGVTDRFGALKLQLPTVQRRAHAGSARIKLVMAGHMDDADHRLTLVENGDRDAPVRHSMDERAGAVDRINHPGITAVATGQPVFLAEKNIGGKGLARSFPDQVLDVAISDRHHILRVALDLDDQRITLLVITERQLASLDGDGFRQFVAFDDLVLFRCHGAFLTQR